MKRWMVAAAFGLAVVGGMVAPGSARATSAAWSQIYQVGVSGGFNDIAAIGNSNIWAVGRTDSAAGNTVYAPFIRHFTGRSWQAVKIPNSSGSTSDWVSASAANNVWVGGLKNSSIATTVVYRWNGAGWVRVPVPAETYFEGVVVLAPNSVWAYGTSGTVSDDVFHWNGTRWQGYLSDSLNFVPQGISASAESNVWVSGYAFSGGKQVAQAYRFDGRTWHAGILHPAIESGPTVTAVLPSNVWIGYYTSTAGYALHWDGHQWHTVTASSSANVLSVVVPDTEGGYWFGAQAILTGSTWTAEQVPGFTGFIGNVTWIPGTPYFLMNAGAETGSSSVEEPTIFRFIF